MIIFVLKYALDKHYRDVSDLILESVFKYLFMENLAIRTRNIECKLTDYVD